MNGIALLTSRSAISARSGERRDPLRLSYPWLRASYQAVEDLERLRDDLIHVVVLVGREATDERDVRRRVCQQFVSLVELGVLRTRHRVVRIAIGAGPLANDCRLGVHLPGQVLELGAARVREVLARIVDDGSELMNRLVIRLELELERAVRQLSEAVVEVLVDRPREDHLPPGNELLDVAIVGV